MIIERGKLAITLQLTTQERQRAIRDLIEREKRISVNAICEEFTISEATARRDLEMLAKDGKIQRVRGGAIMIEESPPELPMLQRENEQTEEKDQIGHATASLVKPGDTILLGSGTTTLAVARQLYHCKDLTVLTNSLPIINLLVGCPGINLIVLGGVLRDTELSFIGHITEKALSEVRADKVILGARAISLEHGITNDFMTETLTDRAIIRIGQKVILVADHTKFGTISTAFLASLEDIDIVVTDRDIDPDYVQHLEEMGVEVILA